MNTTTDQQRINIALAFDKNFLVPFYALITSIFKNNNNINIAFHVIATGINENDRKTIISFVEQNKCEIVFYNVTEKQIEELALPDHPFLPVATYYRLLFPSLLPVNIHRLLYIDTDTIVVGNLTELYDIDLESFPTAAVVENVVAVRHDLGIHEENKYFNAGVLLIDLGAWRNQEITERAMAFAIQNPEKLHYADQCALNYVLKNNWKRIHEKYNLMFGYIPSFKTRQFYESYIRDKVIVHYTYDKPWNGRCKNPYRGLYHFYSYLSPVSNSKKYVDFRFEKKYLKKFLEIRIREAYFNYPILGRIRKLFKKPVKQL